MSSGVPETKANDAKTEEEEEEVEVKNFENLTKSVLILNFPLVLFVKRPRASHLFR